MNFMPPRLNLDSPVDFQTWKPWFIILCSFGIHLIQDFAFQRTCRSLGTTAQRPTHLPWLYSKAEAKRTILNTGTIRIGENAHHIRRLYRNGKAAPICWERNWERRRFPEVQEPCTQLLIPGGNGTQSRISHGVTGSGIREWKCLVSSVQPRESGGPTAAPCGCSTRSREGAGGKPKQKAAEAPAEVRCGRSTVTSRGTGWGQKEVSRDKVQIQVQSRDNSEYRQHPGAEEVSKSSQADLDSHSRVRDLTLTKRIHKKLCQRREAGLGQSELNQEECTPLEVPASWLSSLASVWERRTRREHGRGFQTRITESDAGIPELKHILREKWLSCFH